MDTHQIGQQLKRAGWSACVGLAALTLFTPVFAAPAAPPVPATRLVDVDGNGMNLTPAQQQKLSALETASRAQSKDLFSQLQQTRHKLSDLYRKYDLDTAAAARLNQDLNRVQGQLLDQRLSDQQQLRKILTPDQFTQLQASIQHRPHSGDDHGPGGPGHDHRDWSHNNPGGPGI